MKKTLPRFKFLGFLLISTSLHAGGHKEIKEGAKQFAKEQSAEAISLLRALFEEKKNAEEEQFDPEQAARKTDDQSAFPIERELQEAIESAARAEEIEGSEAFLTLSQTVMESRDKGIGIIPQSPLSIPEERQIESCVEGGSFILTIQEERAVTIIPEKREEIYLCQGHEERKKFYWESDAKNQVSRWQEEYSHSPLIEWHEAFVQSGSFLKSYKVRKRWRHTPGTRCTNNRLENRVVEEEQEKDLWETTPLDVKSLSDLEANLDCGLIQTKEFEPGERTISGRRVYRDSWKKNLIFSCVPDKDSKCSQLRERGGALVHRECLEEDGFGNCLKWKKTYDLGGKAAYQNARITFEEEALFDLEDMDISYEKNREFGQAISILASLQSLGESVSEKSLDPNAPCIFGGSQAKCRRSFNTKNIFDCCYRKGKGGSGICIDTGLGGCNSEERELFQKNKEGKCHYIGPIKHLLQTEQVYCCYPTKLARIIQEEGHKQLGISWGSVEKPNCKGLTLSQLHSLNFEAMDFAEFFEEIKGEVDSEKLAQKLRHNIQETSQTLSQEGAAAKTEKQIKNPKGTLP